MGVQNHIESIRQKPHHQKKRIALAYSGAITGVIFIVWLTVLLPRGIQSSLAQNADQSDNSSLTAAAGDFQQQLEDAQSQFNGATQDAAAVFNATSTNVDPAAAGAQQQYDFGY